MKKTSEGIPSLLENLLVIIQENITIEQNKIRIDIKTYYHKYFKEILFKIL
jgi:hypothetical protein